MYRANSSGILRRRGWPFFVISAGIVAHSCPFTCCDFRRIIGGRGEIQTRVRVAPKPDFESGAFNHSATLPLCLILLAIFEFWQSPNLRLLYWCSILFA